ncbi:MAG: TRAP transporter small permease [Burkholderiaceae bacterium]|nr:TRAP transporter small permease [Burkholderiaceae bacterium]
MIDRIERWSAAIANFVTTSLVVVIAAILLLQVIGRYVFEYPFTWPEELSGLLFVWVIFLGALPASRGGHLMGIMVFVEMLPPRWTRIVAVATNLIVLATLVTLVIKGVDATRAAGSMRMTATGLSWAYVYAALPVGFAALSIAYLGTLMRDLRGIWRR